MKYATFEYKCRRCGRVFDGSSTGAAHALQYLIDAELGMHTAAQAPRMTNSHRCATEPPHNYFSSRQPGQGVGDLIGYREHD